MRKKNLLRSSVVTMFLILALIIGPMEFLAEESMSTEEDHFTLSIMHMNDTHAHLDPMPKMVTAVKEVRKENPDSLLLHAGDVFRSEEHTSELQSRFELVCRLLLE